jgi:cation diffusion facilitator CzcD-associated flavoprotein CzcO
MSPREPTQTSVLIIGAGISGICMGVRLGQAGIPYLVLEKANRVGGTWRENTYPGCACDTQSHHYCFSFELNPDWSRVYAEQPQILTYLEHCSQKYGVAEHIRFQQEIIRATFDATAGDWSVETASGETFSARILVSAVGQLNRPALPEIPGLRSFQGAMFHSAQWDHDFNLTNKDVAVIGNGASALQLIPRLAAAVRQLNVFQRSPNWLVPKGDRSFRTWEKWIFRRIPIIARLYRYWIYWNWERSWPEFLKDSAAAKRKKRRLSTHIATEVASPDLAQALVPDYPVGCKRVLLTDDYYQTMQLENVTLITDPIARIESDGLVTPNGQKHVVDCIVLATGFQATDFLAPMEIRGMNGMTLNETWRNGPEAYLGMTVPGFPNFFMLYGPNTNLGHNSIIFMIECQARYISRAIETIIERNLVFMDVKPETMSGFNDNLHEQMKKTAWVGGCSSWYKTPDGKVVNNWSTTTYRYWWQTRRPNLKHYVLEPMARRNISVADAAESIS